MGVKKGGQGSEHAPSTVLAAVLLADSFTCKFRPITIERPKVLLPLVNVPMIEYSLEWLSGNGVEEVYIFCCAHAQQVVDYIQSSKWRTPATSPAQMIVKPIISHNSLSVGDALRLVDEKKLISSDFVLVSADVVSNMDLAKAIQVHKQRRNESKSSIMTIVMRNARHPLHARRLGDQDQLVALDSSTNQLIQYSVLDQKAGTHSFQNFKIDATAFSERDSIQVRSDLLDVGIYICAPEVLVIYSDNFDYQNIRKDFIQGVLSEEELGNKLYAYPLSREYAAQVHNMRSYDAVSRDIIGRWTYPYVPDTNIFSKKLPATLQTSDLCETIFRMNRGNIYRELTSRIEQMVSVQRGSFIGPATVIKSTSQIVESVIGANCVIGQHAIIPNSYLFDDVPVEVGAQVLNSVVCEGVVICEGAKINPNCVLSHKVVISAQQEVERGTAISLCQQVDSCMEHGSDDEELEYTPRADQDDNEDEGADEAVVEIAQKLAQGLTVDKDSMKDICFAEEVVGSEGAGFVWNLVFSKNAEETALQQISHPSKKELDQYYYKLIQPQLGGTGSSTETKEENLFFKESKESGLATDDDLEQRFRKEVSETFFTLCIGRVFCRQCGSGIEWVEASREQVICGLCKIYVFDDMRALLPCSAVGSQDLSKTLSC
eukprot:TRINITY_DN1826_c0_g1_i2.p1 TRINITY_DN1826_c0_g1~~TRINITY_DN1826_c0_g1_i2.p1  ORF type:complete len:677 (-),score=106.37 TRINITY_DN1826_c0_g1_i2:1026-2999(-)